MPVTKTSTATMNPTRPYAALRLRKVRQPRGGLNSALLSLTASSALSFSRANGVGPHENVLSVQAEITILIVALAHEVFE
jgi:hypothetical protein